MGKNGLKDIPRGIFITGTDTGIGKTVVTAALACCLESSGRDIKVVKPFQTGTEIEAFLDIEFVYKALGRDFDLEDVCPVRLKKPLSPYSAGFFEDVNFNVPELLISLRKKITPDSVTLFEGAGGLLVPITKDYFISDLAKDLGTAVLIVARPGLGTLNHTLLSIQHARDKGLEILGVVICNYPSNPGIAENTNIKVLRDISDVDIVGVVPAIDHLDVEKGNIGDLDKNYLDYFINSLGGSLNINNFLT